MLEYVFRMHSQPIEWVLVITSPEEIGLLICRPYTYYVVVDKFGESKRLPIHHIPSTRLLGTARTYKAAKKKFRKAKRGK